MQLVKVVYTLLLFLTVFQLGSCDQIDLYEYAMNGVIGPDEKTFSSFSLAGTKGSINNSSYTINVNLPAGTAVSSLVPSFSIRGDHVEMGGTVLVSGGSLAIDFSAAVTLTVFARNGTSQDYVVTVTLVAVPVPVAGVSLDMTALSVDHYGTEVLTVTVSPAGATNQTVTWTSNNEVVATVSDGNVYGVWPGTAEITVTTDDGGFTDTCTVEVVRVVDYIYSSQAYVSLSPSGSTTITITGLYTDGMLEPILATYLDLSGGLTYFTVTDLGSGQLEITAGAMLGNFNLFIHYNGTPSVSDITVNVVIL